MENFGENASDGGNRTGSMLEDVAHAEEIRIVLEYLVDSKKKLSSYLLGEIQDSGMRNQGRVRPNRSKSPDGNPDIPENKSISTGASMENVFLNKTGTELLYTQQKFKCEESHHFCKNVFSTHLGGQKTQHSQERSCQEGFQS